MQRCALEPVVPHICSGTIEDSCEGAQKLLKLYEKLYDLQNCLKQSPLQEYFPVFLTTSAEHIYLFTLVNVGTILVVTNNNQQTN